MGLFFYILAGSYGHAAEVAEPGVWEQMQFSPDRQARMVVVGLEIRGDAVTVEVAPSKRSKAVSRLHLCSADSQRPFDQQNDNSEARRAIYAQQILEVLREAYRTGRRVELGFSGPWSPCLSAVRISKAA
jgi:hypothetical protein